MFPLDRIKKKVLREPGAMVYFSNFYNPADDQTVKREVVSAVFHCTILRTGESFELPDD